MNLSEQYRSRLKVLAGIPLNESHEISNPLSDFENYIDLVFNSVNESDNPSPTFEWDIAKEKIDKSTKNLKTPAQAEEYLTRVLEKLKSVPKAIKLRIVKYIIFSLLGLIGYGTLKDAIYKNAPEISAAINAIMPASEAEVEVVEPRASSDSLVNFLKYEEGSITDKGEPVLTPYKLGDGMLTVGWGHAERIGHSQFSPGQTITQEKAEELLKSDIVEAERGLNIILDDWKKDSINVKITQPMYDAMVSMIFNMGIGNFRKTDFIQLVKQGRYEEARERILTTNVSYPGHIPRRQKESEMFGKGIPKIEV